MTADPDGPIDPRNNPESRATERAGAQPVSRGGSGSVVPAETVAPPDEPAETDHAGTAQGDPLGGLTMSKDDRADAVSGQPGPEPTALGQN